MARNAKPWFYERTGCWTAWIDGKRVPLAKGKKSRKAAEDRLKDLQCLARHNPAADSGQHTVASIIDRYLDVPFKTLCSGPAMFEWTFVSAVFRGGWPLKADKNRDENFGRAAL